MKLAMLSYVWPPVNSWSIQTILQTGPLPFSCPAKNATLLLSRGQSRALTEEKLFPCPGWAETMWGWTTLAWPWTPLEGRKAAILPKISRIFSGCGTCLGGVCLYNDLKVHPAFPFKPVGCVQAIAVHSIGYMAAGGWKKEPITVQSSGWLRLCLLGAAMFSMTVMSGAFPPWGLIDTLEIKQILAKTGTWWIMKSLRRSGFSSVVSEEGHTWGTEYKWLIQAITAGFS